ncbi:MAG: putative minor capsid protein [Oscillospiraceae bacterium]
MQPIPKRLLIHKATLLKNGINDHWGNAPPPEMVAILHVRIEPSSKIIQDKQNKQIQLSSLLIYDCKNSSPKNLIFKVQDIIKFNDNELVVASIESFYDEKNLHHIELGLC